VAFAPFGALPCHATAASMWEKPLSHLRHKNQDPRRETGLARPDLLLATGMDHRRVNRSAGKAHCPHACRWYLITTGPTTVGCGTVARL